MAFLIESPTTSEQQRFVAECDYQWQFLQALWNPVSRIQWINTFVSADNMGYHPHILSAAALHGYFVLRGGARQQVFTDLVMKNMGIPCTANVQLYIRIREQQSLAEIQTQDKPEQGWRPTGYRAHQRAAVFNSPACRRDNAAAAAPSPELLAQEAHVFARLCELETAIEAKNDVLKARVFRTPGGILIKHFVDLKEISSHQAREKGVTDCAICQLPLSNASRLTEEIEKKTAEIAEWNATNGSPSLTTLAVQQAHPAERQIAQHRAQDRLELLMQDERNKIIPTDQIEGVVQGLLEFEHKSEVAKDLMSYLVKVTDEAGRCYRPAMTTCGHILGLCCTAQWIEQNKAPTCPFCRHALRRPDAPLHAPIPEEQRDPEESLDLDDVLAGFLAGEPGLENFNLNGLILGSAANGEDPGYESDIDLDDLPEENEIAFNVAGDIDGEDVVDMAEDKDVL